MTRKTVSLVLASFLAIGCALTSSFARAEDIDWKKGRLGHLASTIGTYNNDKVLNDPTVKKALADVVPAKMLPRLKQNLQVSGGIDFIDGHLVLSGNAPHQGDKETVSIWIKIYDGQARVVLKTDGSFYLFAKDEKYEYLPGTMRAYLANPNAFHDKLPAHVKRVRP